MAGRGRISARSGVRVGHPVSMSENSLTCLKREHMCFCGGRSTVFSIQAEKQQREAGSSEGRRVEGLSSDIIGINTMLSCWTNRILWRSGGFFPAGVSFFPGSLGESARIFSSSLVLLV